MLQKCSYMRVLEVFFKEPTSIHFVKEIGKRIRLAPTSVRKHMKDLLKEGLIKKQKSKPFDGFVADRDDESFIFYKRLYNIYSLKNLIGFLAENYYPKAIILFGSYSRGEDIESSDIDIVVITKTKKTLDLSRFEERLKRNIHLMETASLEDFEGSLRKRISNGVILHGGF